MGVNIVHFMMGLMHFYEVSGTLFDYKESQDSHLCPHLHV